MEGFSKGSGPCYPGKYYGVVATNEIGEIQIHPCECSAAFLYSETYGWLWLKHDTGNEGLRARINAVIDEGKRVAMFRPETALRG